MTILCVLLTGVSVGLLGYTFLENKQRQAHQLGVRRRFFNVGPQNRSKPSLQSLPVIGAVLKKREGKRLAHRCEAELPRMLDILAMGMQAGLSFDTAFGLYVHRFENELALLGRERFEIWERGLIGRSEGLAQLAASINLPIFDRFCRTAARSIRYGIPLAPLIREYAEQARKEYRNKQKELVLKAPVKMLLPTGVLILPAMMMLVIGPILLDVAERMV
ncbi:MAG: type II secretion system F family protein [Coriobacteriales bacterium]|jgi:tight adherence protein C|nr:type II secretion system F family protein [Coriobacteriales bacterium]